MAKRRKHVIAIKSSGRVGVEFAAACGSAQGIEDIHYHSRKDGTTLITGYADGQDKNARKRWVRECTRNGITVLPAPWEKQRQEVKPNREQAAEAMRRIAKHD